MAELDGKDTLSPRLVEIQFRLSPTLLDALKIGRTAFNQRKAHDQKPQLNAAAFNQFIIMNAVTAIHLNHAQVRHNADVESLFDQPSVLAGERGDPLTIGIVLPAAAVTALKSCGMEKETVLAGGLKLLSLYLDGTPLRLKSDDGTPKTYPFVDTDSIHTLRSI